MCAVILLATLGLVCSSMRGIDKKENAMRLVGMRVASGHVGWGVKLE